MVPPMQEPELPERLGKYQIIRRLAYGGMAEVLLGRLTGTDGFMKEVVVKRVLPQYASNNEFIAMFRDEARITSRLHHGNIVQVVEFAEEGGQYYLVLEYVDGPSLGATLYELRKRGERLSIPEVAHIAVETARGLDYAHHKLGEDGRPLLIVHRDVSPSNILLSREGVVKLADFGIARARERLSPTQGGAGTLKGKFAYMAPETILRGRLDARSDLFSFGVVLFEMLTGRSAFTGETEAHTIQRVTTEDLPPASSQNRAVPPEFDEIVHRLLDRDPDNRPSRGLEIVDAIGKLRLHTSPPPSELLMETLTRLFPIHRHEARDRATVRPAKPRVIVVDESRTLRALVRASLGQRYTVIEASTGDEARAAMRGAVPDAIVCQRTLQGMSGLELCHSMRENPRLADVPFILLAADITPELEAEARVIGVQAVLPKRFDPRQLEATLQKILES
ncbi:serine/threonine-protein kinase [Polyangium fumosum]|uniref:Response regulator n=2 Tax=Polyangium TaxID=55 RepID=A0A4U1JEK0_9BACT|nr:serine/threonine-protein kinase [Polyangium fumosum]TKD08573.1 response regulator [Polyangium fumosum]